MWRASKTLEKLHAKRLLAQQPARKSCENFSKIAIQPFYHYHEVKIPRAYACKTLTQDLLDGKLCEIPKKNHRKSKGGRRAKKVPKTRDMCRKCSECDTCRRNATQASECNMCRENGVWVLRMRYMSKKRYLGAQHATPVDKMRSRCSECDTCRRNAI